MMKCSRITLTLLLVFLAFSNGQVISWLTGANGDFNTAGSWMGGVVPTGSAIISAAGDYTVSVSQDTSLTGILTLGGALSNPTFTILSGNSLSVDSLVLISGSIVLEAGAELIVSTTTTVSGSIIVDGPIRTTGTTTIGAAASLVLRGSATLEESFSLAAGATLRLEGNHNLGAETSITGVGSVEVNGGTLQVTSGNATISSSTSFNGDSTISGNIGDGVVFSGSTNFNSGVSGSVTIDGGVTVRTTSTATYSSGSIVIQGNSAYEVAGSLSVTSNSASISAGTGGGRVLIAEGGSFSYSVDQGTCTISADFINRGSLTVNSDGNVVVSGAGSCSGSLNLGAVGNGGTLTITGDYQADCGASGLGGTLQFDSQTTRTYILRAAVWSVGAIEATSNSVVETGTALTISGYVRVRNSASLVVRHATSIAADVEVYAGATLRIVGGTCSAVNATFQGTANYAVDVASSTPAILIASGQATLSGTIRLTFDSSFTFDSDVVVLRYASRVGTFASAERQSSSTYALRYEEDSAVASPSEGSGTTCLISSMIPLAVFATSLAL